ncbi:mechanosensitive ion channel family protein [Nocardioides panacis]|uniref:Mechanosensitive ion channel family protein n=1 Tax=Nocardioides panacis TaxID=2849501 RepID=A0A975Y0B3_9ACTN|nr:mechanosensitive ion channel domain-containing protein [Nocardioides panacis]QWZ08288.1 mechanosensitive ion channel family protein [Nocardioides panacis]
MTVTLSQLLVALGSALAAVLVVIVVVHVVVLAMSRRWASARDLARHARRPFRLLLVVLALSAVASSMRLDVVDQAWWDGIRLALRLAAIGTGAWLLSSVLLFLEDLGLKRYRTDVRDNRTARRMRTQMLILRRLTVSVVVVVALGAALLSFPGVRAVGASLLASAGLISVVAALAAQSTLANVFAGIQLAFSDAIRLDDVVIAEEEWGWIEEITLSYVVVRLWDDRRMVLPSTYFTSTPFQNWTRRNSELLGAVELDVDWGVDVGAMRAELERIVGDTELWDGRTQVLQVTDAVGGVVRVRALVTAVDAGTLFDLRCHVREQLVSWVQGHGTPGLPRTRVELVEAHRAGGAARPDEDSDHRGVFSGDPRAEERGALFRGPAEQDG